MSTEGTIGSQAAIGKKKIPDLLLWGIKFPMSTAIDFPELPGPPGTRPARP
jgi:hypothetical protein